MRSRARPCSESAVSSGSGQPSRAAARLKAEGAGHDSISAGVDLARQRGADAVAERVARGQHADAPAARGRRHLRHGGVERARPWPARATDQRRGQRQVPRAAEHEFAPRDRPPRGLRRGRRRRPRRCRRWTARRGCAACSARPLSGHATMTAHPDPRRHHGGRGSWPGSWLPRRPRGHPVARRPHRRARRASRCRSGSAASAAPRASRDYLAASASTLLIDATHPYAARISRQCRRSRSGGRRADARAAAPAVAARRRRPLDRGRRRVGDAVRRSATRRAGSSWRSAGRRSPPFAAAPQHSYLIRSVDPVEPPLPLPRRRLSARPRAVRRGRRTRAARTITASTSSSPRTAAARRPTARSPQRGRSASRWSWCAGPPLPDGAARSRPSRALLRWLDHRARRPPPNAACRPAAAGRRAR